MAAALKKIHPSLDEAAHSLGNSANAIEITEKVFRASDYIYTLKLPSGLEVSCIAPSHLNRDLGTPLGVALKVD